MRDREGVGETAKDKGKLQQLPLQGDVAKLYTVPCVVFDIGHFNFGEGVVMTILINCVIITLIRNLHHEKLMEM